MIKALIFDCWGTVFTNTQEPHPFVVFANKLGYEISDRSFIKIFEQHMMIDDEPVSKHINSLLLELNIEPVAGLVDELTDIILGSLATQTAYVDTIEVLDSLKKSHRLILLSNTFREGFENLQSHYPISGWFESVCLSYQEHTIKPDPILYDTILSRSGLNKDEVIMIGDNYHDDILAANHAGIKAVLLDRRNRYPEVLVRKIHTLHELASHIEST